MAPAADSKANRKRTKTSDKTEPRERAPRREKAGRPETASSTPRRETKQDLLISLLRRPDRASLDEIIAATGWQPHTVRGAIAGALKKRLGLEVGSDKVEGRGRVYQILDSR